MKGMNVLLSSLFKLAWNAWQWKFNLIKFLWKINLSPFHSTFSYSVIYSNVDKGEGVFWI